MLVCRHGTYRKFSNKGAGHRGKPLGASSLDGGGDFPLPMALYRMKIGPLLAEIWNLQGNKGMV